MISCPICNSVQLRLFHDKVWSCENTQVYRCNQCDITFLDPMMNDEDERRFYNRYNDHVKKRGVAASGSAQELHEKSLVVAGERYNAIRRYFSAAESVLEIGAATGAFLQQLQVPMRCTVEPSQENREFSRRFAQQAFAQLAEVPKGLTFDVICMFHVFEHIKRPVEFLQQCQEHLKPQVGKIVIEVPNSADPLISLYDCQAFKDFYFQPMHPYVHSVTSLRKVFGAAGLKEREVIYYQRYGLDNHLNWLAKGKPGGNPAWRRLLGDGEAYTAALTREGLTDTLFYIAEA